MTVVIAGQWRKVGKTAAVCDLIRATPEIRWTVVKITPHAHSPDAGATTDTARYLAAGAGAAHLLHGPPLPEAEHLVIESNAVLNWLTPDVLFLIVDPDQPQWKESALRLRDRAILVERRLLPEHIDRVRRRFSESPA